MSPAPEHADPVSVDSHSSAHRRDHLSTTQRHVSKPPSEGAGETAGFPRADEVADVMSRLALHLLEQPTMQEVTEQVAAAAVAVVPGARDAAVTLHQRRSIVCLAATSDRARHFLSLQDEVGHGPSLEAAFQQRTVLVRCLIDEASSWPQLADLAGELPQVSALCVPLSRVGRLLGTLTLLADGPDAFGEDAERIAVVLCAHAAVAATAAQSVDQLHGALEHRNTIGMAKGILMERLKISADHAFELLLHASRDSNHKLHEVASGLVETGDFLRR